VAAENRQEAVNITVIICSVVEFTLEVMRTAFEVRETFDRTIME
jgi:hypothetical protein